jgi:hypothetical protein
MSYSAVSEGGNSIRRYQLLQPELSKQQANTVSLKPGSGTGMIGGGRTTESVVFVLFDETDPLSLGSGLCGCDEIKDLTESDIVLY